MLLLHPLRCLSRLPSKSQEVPITFDEPAIFNVSQLKSLPTLQELRAATLTDPVLSKVVCYVQSGWPQDCTPTLCPYLSHRFELMVEGECLLWGIQVIVPKKLQKKLLKKLHKDHPGISRMKSVCKKLHLGGLVLIKQ